MKSSLHLTLLILTSSLIASTILAEESKEQVSVNLSNFVRAESDHMIRSNMKMMNVDFGAFMHLREPPRPTTNR